MNRIHVPVNLNQKIYKRGETMQDYETKSKKQIISFLALCTPQDVEFIDLPRDQLTVDDYAWMFAITMTLDFRTVAIRVIGKAEQDGCVEQVIERIKSLHKNGSTAKQSVIDFLKNIPLTDAKLQSYIQTMLNQLHRIDGKTYKFMTPL